MTKLRKIIASLFSVVALAALAISTAMTTGAAAREVRYETAQREAGEPIMAIVSIDSQKVEFYDANGWIFRAPVSTGTRGRETPAGIFAVVEKNKVHRSNMYDDAKMPNMQRITWNGIAMHGGPLPGYAASHGCVRMPFDFAAKVFNKTRIGMRVIISPNDAAPVEFYHPTLFSPDAEVVAAAPERADRLKREANEAAKGYKQAKKDARSTARKVVLQKRFLRKLEWRKKRADAKLKRADKTLSSSAKAKARAYDRLQQAAAKATEAASQLEAANSALEAKVVAAAAAATDAKEATQKRDAAKKVEKSAGREVELQRETLRKLKGLKKSADTKLISADKALSVADKSKVQAEERKRKAIAETKELVTLIKIAESDLQEKVVAAEAAAAAANDATQISNAAKKVDSGAARLVESRKTTLGNLKSLKEIADSELMRTDKELPATDKTKATAETAELARQIATIESDLKTRMVNAAVVAKIANNAIQKSDAAIAVEKSAAREVELQKQTLAKLEGRKKRADAELTSADEALSVANKAKVQAEELQQKATGKTTELATQIETAESDLKEKIVTADAATTAANSATQARNKAKKVEKSAARDVVSRKADLRKLKGLQKRADAELRRTDTALARADKAKLQAEERQRKATADATELATQLEAAKSDLQDKITAAATAKEAVKTAKIRKAETAQSAYEAKLALEPASVYISRATQKLYVRRNTHKPAIDGGGEEFDSSIEVPVTIRDPYIPIGTHIFTAMEHNELGLRWTAVTIDGAEDAKSALDRITIPQDVFDRIAPTALPRSSIIISDEPLSRETNYRTEFVTVLSNYPQGGFITRKPTPVPDAEESDEESDEENDVESSFVRRTPSFLNF